jgi:chromosomal replication initiator protein
MTRLTDRLGEVMTLLERSVEPRVWNTWCRNLSLRETGENAVEVPAPNSFYRDFLERELRVKLEDVFHRVFGSVPDIVFQVDPGFDVPTPAPPPALAPLPAPARPASDAPPLVLNPAYLFETFVTGPSNRLANAAAQAVSEKPGRGYNPLFIHGGAGLGKTHLLQAICHQLLALRPAARIVYVSCEQFVNDYISAIEKKRVESFRSRYRSADLLVVDDVHFLSGKEASQEEFFHTFDSLHLAGRQIVLSSDSPPRDIRTLKDRLVSRFASGFSISIDPPTYEMRVAIMRRVADHMHKDIPGDVLTFVAGAVHSNVRELVGAVNKIIGMASLSQRPVDLALAQEVLKTERLTRTASVTVPAIQELVARHYGLKLADFSARTWRKSTSLPRQVCIYLCRRFTDLSMAEIGGHFGRRDHTTVLYAIRRVEELLPGRPSLQREVDVLTAQLQAR